MFQEMDWKTASAIGFPPVLVWLIRGWAEGIVCFILLGVVIWIIIWQQGKNEREKIKTEQGREGFSNRR